MAKDPSPLSERVATAYAVVVLGVWAGDAVTQMFRGLPPHVILSGPLLTLIPLVYGGTKWLKRLSGNGNGSNGSSATPPPTDGPATAREEARDEQQIVDAAGDKDWRKMSLEELQARLDERA